MVKSPWLCISVMCITGLGLLSGPALGKVKVQRVAKRPCLKQNGDSTIYSFQIEDIWNEKNVSFSEASGKLALIVNVATYWSFTHHYLGLNALQSKYGDKLVIYGFPCNQFGLQEPGSNATEIMNGIMHVRPGEGFKPNFRLMKKIEVNGEKEHPLYTYLKSRCPPTRDGFSNKHDLFYAPFKNWDVRWNWEKFLIGKDGRPIMRYDASTEPGEQIDADIAELLGSPAKL